MIKVTIPHLKLFVLSHLPLVVIHMGGDCMSTDVARLTGLYMSLVYAYLIYDSAWSKGHPKISPSGIWCYNHLLSTLLLSICGLV